jgi:hypothetical protein
MDPRDERLAEVRVAQHHACVEEAERALQILICNRDGFSHRPHAVVELESGIPERIPEPICDALYVASLVVQEEDVQVASGTELPASVPANGENRHAVALLDELTQPTVSQGRVRAPEGTAPRRRVAEQCLEP